MSRVIPSAVVCGVLALASTLIAPPSRAGAASPAVTVERAWVRPAPAGLPSSAAYFVIRNTGSAPDTLEAVSTPAAGLASLHESMNRGGVMNMQPLGPLAVPPRGVVELKPGGMHVMLERLNRPLKAGDRLPLTLVFKRAGSVVVMAEVRPTAP